MPQPQPAFIFAARPCMTVQPAKSCIPPGVEYLNLPATFMVSWFLHHVLHFSPLCPFSTLQQWCASLDSGRRILEV